MGGQEKSRDGYPPVRVVATEPRILGFMPPLLALILGIGAIAIGIAALAGGSAGGLLALIAGVALLLLVADSARRWPTSLIPRTAIRATDAARARLGLARATSGAWSNAAREMLRLRRERRTLIAKREDAVAELGEAAYREDGEVDDLRSRVEDLDLGIRACEEEIEAVIAETRQRLERERAAVPETRSFAVAEEPPDPGERDPTRPIPTALRDAREGT